MTFFLYFYFNIKIKIKLPSSRSYLTTARKYPSETCFKLHFKPLSPRPFLATVRINGLYCKKYIDWEKIEKEAPQFVVSFLMFYHSPFYIWIAISSQFFAILKILALKINVMIHAYRLLDKLKLNINLQTKFSRYCFSIFKAKSLKSMI